MKRIRTVEQVSRIADQRRAVWFHGWNGPKPAAFVIGMPARTVLSFIRRGMFEYPSTVQRAKLQATNKPAK